VIRRNIARIANICTIEFVIVINKGFWRKIASDRCVGARGNHYKEIIYRGQSTFIIAMKLVYKKGKIGCYGGTYTRWGCNAGNPTNIIVTGIFDVP
jgi:hypothetical protein